MFTVFFSHLGKNPQKREGGRNKAEKRRYGAGDIPATILLKKIVYKIV
jgi:hypothetical protein